MITYDILRKKLKEKNITRKELRAVYHLSTSTIEAIETDRSITINTLNQLANILDCKEDEQLISYIPDKRDRAL